MRTIRGGPWPSGLPLAALLLGCRQPLTDQMVVGAPYAGPTKRISLRLGPMWRAEFAVPATFQLTKVALARLWAPHTQHPTGVAFMTPVWNLTSARCAMLQVNLYMTSTGRYPPVPFGWNAASGWLPRGESPGEERVTHTGGFTETSIGYSYAGWSGMEFVDTTTSAAKPEIDDLLTGTFPSLHPGESQVTVAAGKAACFVLAGIVGKESPDGMKSILALLLKHVTAVSPGGTCP